MHHNLPVRTTDKKFHGLNGTPLGLVFYLLTERVQPTYHLANNLEGGGRGRLVVLKGHDDLIDTILI